MGLFSRYKIPKPRTKTARDPDARRKLRPRDQITPEYAWYIRQEALEYALDVLPKHN